MTMEISGYWFAEEDRFVSIEESERNFDEAEKEKLLKPLYIVEGSRTPVALMSV